MSAVITAGKIFYSVDPLEYSPGKTFLQKAAFSLNRIDELFQMFTHDHVIPVAGKLGYAVQLDTAPEFGYFAGKPKIVETVKLSKGEKIIEVYVKPGSVDIAYFSIYGKETTAINLKNPTFSLMDAILGFERMEAKEKALKKK
jgi:hypothetical protein